MERPTREKLEAENARLAGQVHDLEAGLAERDDRLRKLEELVERLQRRGKRQAAPFSKGNPVLKPRTPGRKSGEAHGRHGHRSVLGRVDVARQGDRTTLPPVAWDHLPGVSALVGLMMAGRRWRGQLRRRRRGRGVVVAMSRPGFWRCR